MAFFKKMCEKLLGEEEETDTVNMLTASSEKGGALPESPRPSASLSASARSIELKIAKLTAFNEQVMEVADHLIAGRPVVLNLEGASKEATKRIIDFFSGVAYTVQGQLKVIAGSIYIVTPSSVDVSHETLLASAMTGTATAGTGALFTGA